MVVGEDDWVGGVCYGCCGFWVVEVVSYGFGVEM